MGKGGAVTHMPMPEKTMEQKQEEIYLAFLDYLKSGDEIDRNSFYIGYISAMLKHGVWKEQG
jgi:hypothetical protein